MTNNNMQKKRSPKFNPLVLAGLVIGCLIIAFFIYNMIYGENIAQKNDINNVIPVDYNSTPGNITIQALPSNDENATAKNSSIPDSNAGIPIIKLGGVRPTNFDSIVSRVNNSAITDLLIINNFNSSNDINNFRLTFYKKDDTAFTNANTTPGKHFVKFEVYGEPPQPVSLLVDANGQKSIIKIYNSKLYHWTPVYIEAGNVAQNGTFSLRITFLEDTPPAYASKFDRNAYVQNVNILTFN